MLFHSKEILSYQLTVAGVLGRVEKHRIVQKRVVSILRGFGVDESVVGEKVGLAHIFVKFIILSINFTSV